MPIEHRIYHDRKLVAVRGLSMLSDEDIFGYQRSVWSLPEVSGYDELMDMTGVCELVVPTPQRMQHLASLSAAMDRAPRASKFAIVAPQDLAFGLGKMYEVYRGLEGRGTKEVSVFRTLEEACAYLGFKGWLPRWDESRELAVD